MKLILTSLLMLLVCLPVIGLPEDRYQPIEIQADSALRNQKSGFTQYQGNVILSQGSMKLEADNLQVTENKAEDKTELIAMGMPATFEQQPSLDKPIIKASAKTINYNPDEGIIRLTGNARLKQGESEINSDTIVYMVNQQVFKAETDSQSEKPGRVQVVIPAKEKPDQGENQTNNTSAEKKSGTEPE